jgi:hypothetical protein
MNRIAPALLWAAICWGQQPSDLFTRAPKAVDEALRARISEFYQDHVEGKYRQAEQLVAEDTKDFFYTANKPRYLGFEIRNIDYSEEFTKAKATILVEQHVMMPGFSDKPFKVPIASTWKLVDGKWYWYVDQEALRHTPFGTIKGGSETTSGPAALPRIPGDIASMGIQNQVKADKNALALTGNKAEEVRVTNGAPGQVSIEVLDRVEGVDVSVAPKDLKAGETAVVTVRRAAAKVKHGTLRLQVIPTNQVIPIQVDLR